jgi:hypothetical protein
VAGTAAYVSYWLVRTAADGALVQEQGLDQLMVQSAAEADPISSGAKPKHE